ncbi:MAG: hypothetical protein A2150_07745 [Candidatus Muproteobacteria bacterium RBG_16_64_11]|uniref:Multidrug resistance protein MdtA-like C-terminal permuted SH3 domain-containing protein n=1 Tax=Candidatus Muproteobacteria bacterium RBG_16_64_11 TaxID=1817758 RepID=A0A1F6TDF4_9PROT|nr:MAG: hypothetical protein A2150_07745 [Candidatus Muproteobacteria bacterium RBG_16_64_11]
MLLGLLTACNAPPPPSSAPPLPRLERPTLTVPAADTRNFLVPRAALVERAGLPGVFVLNADGQARFRLVRPGKTLGDNIEILSGLRGGETLVTGELGAVRDGTPVKIHETADKRR